MAVTPARVSAALALLDHLASSESPELIEGHTTLPGRDLLPVEQQARATALNMLIAYFNGTLGMTWFEIDEDVVKTQKVVVCPMCQGKTNADVVCQMCCGRGEVIAMGAG